MPHRAEYSGARLRRLASVPIEEAHDGGVACPALEAQDRGRAIARSQDRHLIPGYHRASCFRSTPLARGGEELAIARLHPRLLPVGHRPPFCHLAWQTGK